MVRAATWPVLAGAALMASIPASAAPADCAARLQPSRAVVQGAAVTAASLVELLDFGRADSSLEGAAPFSVSPDGRLAVMAVRRADPVSDSYCIGVALVTLDGSQPPRLLDIGGEFIAMTHDVRDAPEIVNGSPDPGTPLWSPDGRHIAYLRRDGGRTQLWTVGLDGEPARPLTRFAIDVTGFRWATDGKGLLVKTRPGLIDGRARIDAEGRSGFLFDRRFWPLSDDRPRPPLPIPVETFLVDVDGQSPPRRGAPPAPSGEPAGAPLFARSADGAMAWTAPADAGAPFGPERLHVSVGGRERTCGAACADGVGGLWWREPGVLLFMTAGRAANGGRTGLYRWDLTGAAGPIRVYDTADALFGCALARQVLICAHETATHPRTIVALDPASGAITTLFDPNPDFAARRFGEVRRLTFTRGGATSYGDLVLPPDRRPGQRVPLVVVQYISRGFLRGGTGDDVPIHLLAARGFAVLSFQRPAMLPAAARAPSLAAAQRINIANWAERRSILGLVDAGIDAAIATGAVDPAKIGITGLSDGSVTAQFALLHSTRFKAAAIATCCDDPASAMTIAGLSYRDAVLAWGYARPGPGDAAFWRPYSLVRNAARMRTPLLIQVPDAEYRLALETYSALQLHGAPVEMYVFPDEHHVKSHPAHRLAIYNRYVAWFDFWLRGKESTDPADRGEMERWRLLRTKAATPVPGRASRVPRPRHRRASAGG